MTRLLRLPLLVGLVLGAAGCAHAGAGDGDAQAAPPKARAKLAPVVPKAGEGVVHVVCTPSSAEVVVDGVTYGYVSDFDKPPYLKLTPGEHHIVLRKKGYEPYRTEVYLSGSVIETLTVSLDRRSQPAAGDARETKP